MAKTLRPKKPRAPRWCAILVILCLSCTYLFLARFLSRPNKDPEPPNDASIPPGLLDLSMRGFQLFSRCIDFQCDQECTGKPNCCADILFKALMFLERILRKYKVVHYACFGTALGAVREHDIIPWTSDVDLCGPNVTLPAGAIEELYNAGLLYFLIASPQEIVDRAKICLTPKAFASDIVPFSAKLPGNMKGKTARIPYIDLYQDTDMEDLDVTFYAGETFWEERSFQEMQDNSITGRLERLQAMFQSGALTEAEFLKAKEKELMIGVSLSQAPLSLSLPPSPSPRNTSYLYWLQQPACLTAKAVIYPLHTSKIRDLEVFVPRNITNYLRQWYGPDYMTAQHSAPEDCMHIRGEPTR